MKRAAMLPLIGMLSVVVGCGGLGTAGFPNPYRGKWNGLWNSPTLSENGSLTLDVAEDGTFSGTFSNTSRGLTGSITGSTGFDGDMNADVSFGTTTSGYTLKGRLNIYSSSVLDATFKLTYLGREYGGTWEMTSGSGGGSTGGTTSGG